MSEKEACIVYNFANPWMREVIRESAPDRFDIRFVERLTEGAADQSALAQLLGEADFLVTIELPDAWVKWLTRCRLVMTQGVGYDAVDVAALREAKIPLALTPEGTTEGVAEHTILFILALYKRLAEVDASVSRGEFDKIGWRSKCHLLYGKTLGLVGFGRIGQRVAQLARAFDVRVLYTDVQQASSEVETNLEAEYRDFDGLLGESDIISLHTPLTEGTKGLFGEAQFAAMRPGALFINTSRGGTYDMDALHEVIASGHLGGAGLDVFNPQPPPADHPILQLANVLCSPHMATGTVETHHQKATAQFENFARVLDGQPPQNVI